MNDLKIITILLGSVGALAQTAAVSPPPVASRVAAPAMAGTVTGTVSRTISLRELGFSDGASISGLLGSRTLYFPVPSGTGAANFRLTLPYRTSSAFPSRRAITVEVAGHPLYTASLPEAMTTGTIDIPVDAGLARGGYLDVRIVYTGAITGDRCVDQRVSGAFVDFAPEGALRYDIDGAALGRIAVLSAAMPRSLMLDLPANADPRQAAAALTLLLGNADGRIARPQAPGETGTAGWSVSRIGFAGSAAPALAITPGTPGPGLVIGGQDPAAAARLVRSRWIALAGAPTATTASRAEAGERKSLTLAEIGADTSVQGVSDRGSWRSTVPVASLPPKRRLSGAELDVAVAEDGNPVRPVISVLMNGVQIVSATADKSGRTHIPVTFASGLVTSQNDLEVSVLRQPVGGDCKNLPQAYPAQLLPSSRLTFEDAGAPEDFSDIPSAFNSGFTAVLRSAADVGPVAALLAPLASGQAPVSVSYNAVPDTGPLVYVGTNPPPGTDPKIRFDQGRVEIRAESGTTLLDPVSLAELTTVQILDMGGRAVLWIRPGRDFATLDQSAKPPLLSYGNVAFLRGDQMEFAFNDKRERLIDIQYPDRFSLAQFLDRYRILLIGLGWLIATIAFVVLLRRVLASRKPAD